ncbi:Maf family protein [Futiania mangrovi]|uniref:Nucleoside triphosphate pyrophosphatase n=1 Tax=Futiania mangrovi TaxID=2959716 RepID=A0A9J6PIW9_9PROT|nr:Maf family protein [Futiania mangrovii]MCP1336495.1 Maf family protein [Futiania mangrovii]
MTVSDPQTLGPEPPLVLASGSPTRARLLRDAGLSFAAVRAPVDEAEVAASLLAEGLGGRDLADALAEIKAVAVARRAPGSVVIGCDQVLVCDGQVVRKAGTAEQAAATLQLLSGKTHHLYSAAVAVIGGNPAWRHVGHARLTVRPLSDAFIARYLEIEGASALGSVGCYRIEGPGVHLFSRIEGDTFTIQGLPLLELLDWLRARGDVPS